VRRTLRSVNIAEEALAGAVAPTAAVLAAAADSIVAREAEEDSTVVAADTSAARVSERAVSRATANGWWLVQEIWWIGHACEQQFGILRRPHGWLEWPAQYQRHGPDEGWVALM